jgi:hypothetical protein
MSGKANVGLPPIQSSNVAADMIADNNPFRLPGDDKIFRMREEERRKKEEARQANMKLKVWQKNKTELLSRSQRLQELVGEGRTATLADLSKTDNDIAPKIVAPRRQEKENMTEFVAKKSKLSRSLGHGDNCRLSIFLFFFPPFFISFIIYFF